MTGPVRAWRKVYEQDLPNIIHELEESVELPAVIILTGEMGVGKTTFSKNFIKVIQPDLPGSMVNSPTYSVVNELGDVVHADFYRLKAPEEVVHLELPLYLEDKDFFLVEWGKDYLRELHREVPENFTFYELVIECNPIQHENEIPSRNLILKHL